MFITRAVISFIIGGLFIALQTIIAERAPLRWRGTILTIPSTSAISFFFIGLTKQPGDITEVAKFFPASLAVCYVFVFVFAILSKSNIYKSLFSSFIIWAVCAFIIVKFPPHSFFTSIFIYYLPVLLLTYWGVKNLPQTTTITPVLFTPKIVFFRSLIGGLIVILAVVLSKILGNIWGGLFSAFPAAFTSTFLIYYQAHGKNIIPSVAKSLFFPGSIGFIIYALMAAFTFPRYGVWLGTLSSYATVTLFFLFYQFIKKYENNYC